MPSIQSKYPHLTLGHDAEQMSLTVPHAAVRTGGGTGCILVFTDQGTIEENDRVAQIADPDYEERLKARQAIGVMIPYLFVQLVEVDDSLAWLNSNIPGAPKASRQDISTRGKVQVLFYPNLGLSIESFKQYIARTKEDYRQRLGMTFQGF